MLSQTPADGRHTAGKPMNESTGHAALEPVQLSATSHTPAEGRHVVVEGA